MLVLLGGGVFLQKIKIIDNQQLEYLLLAFDKDATKEKEDSNLKEMFKKINEKNEQSKKEIEKTKNKLKVLF